jgi:hypothetical protein
MVLNLGEPNYTGLGNHGFTGVITEAKATALPQINGTLESRRQISIARKQMTHHKAKAKKLKFPICSRTAMEVRQMLVTS